ATLGFEPSEVAHGGKLEFCVVAVGGNLHLVEHRPKVDAVAGEDGWPAGQLYAEGLMALGVPGGGQAHDLAVAEHVEVAVDQLPVVAEVEVVGVVEPGLDQARMVSGVPFRGLDKESGVGNLRRAAAVVEVEMAERDDVDVRRAVSHGREAGGEVGAEGEIH